MLKDCNPLFATLQIVRSSAIFKSLADLSHSDQAELFACTFEAMCGLMHSVRVAHSCRPPDLLNPARRLQHDDAEKVLQDIRFVLARKTA